MISCRSPPLSPLPAGQGEGLFLQSPEAFGRREMAQYQREGRCGMQPSSTLANRTRRRQDGKPPCIAILDDQEPGNPLDALCSTPGSRQRSAGEVLDDPYSSSTIGRHCSMAGSRRARSSLRARRLPARKVANRPCSATWFQKSSLSTGA